MQVFETTGKILDKGINKTAEKVKQTKAPEKVKKGFLSLGARIKAACKGFAHPDATVKAQSSEETVKEEFSKKRAELERQFQAELNKARK